MQRTGDLVTPVAPTLRSEALRNMEQRSRMLWLCLPTAGPGAGPGLATDPSRQGCSSPWWDPGEAQPSSQAHPQKGRGLGRDAECSCPELGQLPRWRGENYTLGLKSGAWAQPQPLCSLVVPPWQVSSPRLLSFPFSKMQTIVTPTAQVAVRIKVCQVLPGT